MLLKMVHEVFCQDQGILPLWVGGWIGGWVGGWMGRRMNGWECRLVGWVCMLFLNDWLDIEWAGGWVGLVFRTWMRTDIWLLMCELRVLHCLPRSWGEAWGGASTISSMAVTAWVGGWVGG